LISLGGNVKASGNYGDTAKLGSGMVALNLSTSGLWPYYQALYKDTQATPMYHGCAIGWLNFSNGVVGGTLTWVKETDPGSIGITPVTYLTGFTNDYVVMGSGWTNAMASPFDPCFTFAKGLVEAPAEGPLLDPVSQVWTNGSPFAVNSPAFGKNKVGHYTNNVNAVSLTLTPKTGKISGAFKDNPFSATPNDYSYVGAILQNVDKAYGYQVLSTGPAAGTPANIQVTGEVKVEAAP